LYYGLSVEVAILLVKTDDKELHPRYDEYGIGFHTILSTVINYYGESLVYKSKSRLQPSGHLFLPTLHYRPIARISEGGANFRNCCPFPQNCHLIKKGKILEWSKVVH
jgi:hypothetical protein